MYTVYVDDIHISLPGSAPIVHFLFPSHLPRKASLFAVVVVGLVLYDGVHMIKMEIPPSSSNC